MRKKYIFIILTFVYSTFCFSQNWEAVANNSLDEIFTLYHDTLNNQLLASGYFYNFATDESINGLVKLENNTWKSFDDDQEFLPLSVIIFNDSLFASSDGGNANISKWSDSTWTIVGETNGIINNLYSFKDSLFAVGRFLMIDNIPMKNLGKRRGSNFTKVGTYITALSQFYCMAEYKGELYVGGKFAFVDPENTTTSYSIMRWNGLKWRDLLDNEGIISYMNEFVNTNITKMIEYKDELYIMGRFKDSDNADNHIMRWDGENYHSIGGGLNGTPEDAIVFNDELYVVGEFTKAGYNTPSEIEANGIVKWDGEKWCNLGNDLAGVIYDIEEYNNELYVSGNIQYIGGVIVNNTAKWIGGDYTENCTDVISSNDEFKSIEFSFSITPNPTSNTLNITLENVLLQKNIQLQITDLLGQSIFQQHIPIFEKTWTHQLDVSAYPSGTYFLTLQNGESVVTRKFIIAGK